MRGLDLRQFGVVERRYLDDRVLDSCGLQEACAHLLHRIVAAREDDAHRSVVPREGHEVAEGVARGLLKQALDALDEDDLASLRGEDGAERRPFAGTWQREALRRYAAGRIPPRGIRR